MRRWFVILLTVMAVLSFAACGGGDISEVGFGEYLHRSEGLREGFGSEQHCTAQFLFAAMAASM